MIRAWGPKDSLLVCCTILVLLEQEVELVLHELNDVDLLDGNLSGKILSGKILSGKILLGKILLHNLYN